MAGKPPALAKLSRPRVHDVLPRPRLYTRLDDALRAPAVWLAAPPGAGKTTLLASWLEQRKRSGIWYQVDAGDADPASFIYHLRLAAAAAAKRADAALPLLTPEYLRDLDGFARRFFRRLFELLGASAVLVLDNLQDVADDAALHRVVAEAMRQLPEGVNLAVLSRAEPNATYAPLLADGTIALADGDALRFDLAEAQAVAHKRGVADPAAIRALHSRSRRSSRVAAALPIRR